MRKRIVLVQNIISPYTTLLFAELHRRCPEFEVVYLAKRESNRQWRIDEEERSFPHEVLFQERALDDVGAISQFVTTWAMLGRVRPDLCIVGGYSYPGYWAAILWIRMRGVRAVLWSSSTQVDHPRHKWREWIKSLLVEGFDAYNTYGKRAKQYLAGLGVDETRIVCTGLPTDNKHYESATERFRAERLQTAARHRLARRNFIYVGRLSPEKNIGSLISAFELMKGATGCEWGVILVGDGPQRAELEEHVRSRGLDAVRFVGFQQMETLPVFLAASDVLVLPSTSETWGLVVNEAMAAGLPVLVSNRCGCCPELLRDGENGYTFDPFDVPALATHMTACANGTYDLARMGEQSKRIVASMTLDSAADKIHETLIRVMSRDERETP